MKYLFFDTETTGLEEKDEVIQLAYIIEETSGDPNIPTKFTTFKSYFSSDQPIEIGAMAVHHITQEMIDGKPKLTEFVQQENLQAIFDDCICIAHNSEFDVSMLAKHGLHIKDPICTKKVAYKLCEDSERHNLQFLRYDLGLYKKEEELLNPHDALSDCVVLKNLFDHLFFMALEKELEPSVIIDTMRKITARPMKLRKLLFGKYKDQSFEEVAEKDLGYLQWMSGQSDLMKNEDLKFTIEQFLK